MILAETERLLIRSWELSDGEHYQKMSRDEGYNRFAHPGYYLAKNDDEVTEKIRQRMTTFEKHGLGKFPVFLRKTNEFIGTCGLDLYSVKGKEEVELGYRLCLEHWGKGYATESARAIVDYGLEKLQLPRILAFAVPQNPASLKVIEKLGFRHIGELMHAGNLHILYEKLREG